MLFCLHFVCGYVCIMTAEWSGYNSSQSQIAHKTKDLFLSDALQKIITEASRENNGLHPSGIAKRPGS